jgi:hypothetical protein
MYLNRVSPLTNTGQHSPSSVKAIVAQIEMSLSLLTKAFKGKGPATTDDTEDVILPPVPAHKSGRSRKQPVDRSTAVPTILSGSIAVNEGTPVILTVEGANDQSDRSSNLPSDLEAV